MAIDTTTPNRAPEDFDSATEYLGRGIDYLGDLGAKLRDLQGFATLARELIQNADDAAAASSMVFDVTDAALIVENDGVFSDCGEVQAAECPWKHDSARGHRCDFHRLRWVAGGDKRGEEGTTGAFGIGFTAVYQITDRPELVSGGRHWILREDQPEHQRIQVCPGCALCRAPDLPGTRFFLPWVFDPDTPLRQELRAAAVRESDPAALREELVRSVPTAMLFLKRLKSIAVRVNGRAQVAYERIEEGDTVLITDGARDQVWHLVAGSFDTVAAELRDTYGVRIETKRSSKVTIALPAEGRAVGVLCAVLPTQHDTGLPFHVNADFYPTNDRKRVIFEADYQTEWNRAAVRAAAEAFGLSLPRLRNELGHRSVWQVLSAVHETYRQVTVGQGESSLGDFWEVVEPMLLSSDLVFTTQSEWRRPAQTRFLYEDDLEALAVLEGLGLDLVHEDLRPHHNLLRQVGVAVLEAEDVAAKLRERDMTERIETEDLPEVLQSREGLSLLLGQISRLLERSRRREEAGKALAECAIAPGRDGALWPCREIYRADNETVDLFIRLDPQIPFLAYDEDLAVLGLCPEFTPIVALDFLHGSGEALSLAEVDPGTLLAWFEARKAEVLRSPASKQKLVTLPIFPTAGQPAPLKQLALPGNFTDPFGLASLLSVERLGGRIDFLRELGARELTFQHYATEHLPKALGDPDVSADDKLRAIELLALHLGEILDLDSTRDRLKKTPLVHCEDAELRQPERVYFRTPIVEAVLGTDVAFAELPATHYDSVRELYRWLGVVESPRDEDVRDRIAALVSEPPKPESVGAIQEIFRHLGERLRGADSLPRALSSLSTQAWLPAQDDLQRWFRPTDLFAVFRNYLFQSQATFLGISREVQNSSTHFMRLLGVKENPSIQQVVDHLLNYAAKGIDVNREVYRYLDDAADNPAVQKLKQHASLLLSGAGYVRPNQVFWGEHPFGPFRHQLSSEFRPYSALLEQLDVRQQPDHRDAKEVILEIAALPQHQDQPLGAVALTVVMRCWAMFDRALEEGSTTEEFFRPLRTARIVPDRRHHLRVPGQVFFEDRVGIADRFGEWLQDQIIPRPQDAWRAMAAAGVRPLSAVIVAYLSECTDPVEDPLLSERVHTRRAELARVLLSGQTGTGGGGQHRLELLDQLRLFRASELRIQYGLKADNREQRSEVEDVPAHFHRETSVMYFRGAGGTPPWPSIARELALAVSPDMEPGRAASGIKDVLAAQSEVEARQVLDELGYPAAEVQADDTEIRPNVAEGFGGSAEQEEATAHPIPPSSDPATEPTGNLEDEEDGRKGTDSAGPGTPSENQPNGTSAPTRGGQGLTPGTNEPGDTPTEGTAPGRSQPADLRVTKNPAASPDSPKPGKTSRPATSRQGRLRTYVSPAVSPERGTTDPESSRQLTETDRAGIRHVLEYEHAHGREPKEMAPNHEGYDIESRDPAGRVRHIEVKSIAGEWGTLGAALSAPQFNKGRALRDRFWLYVVERAGSSDARVYPINNPAQRVDQYFYDDGWKALAEDEPLPESSAEGGNP